MSITETVTLLRLLLHSCFLNKEKIFKIYMNCIILGDKYNFLCISLQVSSFANGALAAFRL